MRFPIFSVALAVVLLGCTTLVEDVSETSNSTEPESSTRPTGRVAKKSSEPKAERPENNLVRSLQRDPHLSVRHNDSDGTVLVVIRSGGLFDKAGDLLSPMFTQILDRIATVLLGFGDSEIRVRGHTDSHGDPQFNFELSEKRAETVRAYLVSKGLDGASITSEGRGSLEPVASNATLEGRGVNRRVDLLIRLRNSTPSKR